MWPVREVNRSDGPWMSSRPATAACATYDATVALLPLLRHSPDGQGEESARVRMRAFAVPTHRCLPARRRHRRPGRPPWRTSRTLPENSGKGPSDPAENAPRAPPAGPSRCSDPSVGPPERRLRQSRGHDHLGPHHIWPELRIYPQIPKMDMPGRRRGSSVGCFGDICSQTCSGRPREGAS